MAATSSRASSISPEKKEPMTWTTATFSFPPRASPTVRAPIPRQRSKSRESRTSPSTSSSSSSSNTTSRVINNIPGFDDFAELVMSSERAVPRLTLTPADHSSRRPRRSHPHRPKPSEPRPTVPIVPAETASLPWSKDDNDAGRVTFIFGRFRPSVARRSAPPSTQSTSDQIRSKDFVNIPSPQEQPATQP